MRITCAMQALVLVLSVCVCVCVCVSSSRSFEHSRGLGDVIMSKELQDCIKFILFIMYSCANGDFI